MGKRHLSTRNIRILREGRCFGSPESVAPVDAGWLTSGWSVDRNAQLPACGIGSMIRSFFLSDLRGSDDVRFSDNVCLTHTPQNDQMLAADIDKS